MVAVGHCLVVEDLPTTAAWLQQVVAQAFPQLHTHTCGDMASARVWLDSYAQNGAQTLSLILLDLGLPDGCGGDLLPWISQHLPQTATVVATIYDDDEHVFQSLAAGARGYLLKDDSAEALVAYLQRIDRGEPPLSPAIARRILQHFHVGSSQLASKTVPSQPPAWANSEQAEATEAALSPRESQTLQWIAQGLTVAECAKQMELSPLTVAGYVKKVYQKLQISTRAEATREAMRRGML